MYKTFMILIFLLIICTCFVGCEKEPDQDANSPTSKKGLLATLTNKIDSPDKILKKYLEASLHNLNEEAYKYISVKDKNIKSLAEYLAENAERQESPFASALSSKIKYNIEKIEQNENEAKAIVAITMPDFGSIFMDLMGAAFASAISGENNDTQIEKLLVEKYSDKDIPLTITKETFTLLKETDGWKVFLDWEAQKINAEKAEKVKGLLAEAEDLKENKKLYGALAKYNEILELDSEVVEAKEGVKKTEIEINDFEEKQAYIKNVELKNFRVGEGQKYSFGDPEPAVFGTIVNNGNRTLNKVELTVYFLNEEGVIIGEEDYHPVLVSEYSFGDDNKPLKPNYVKDFGYTVKDSAPSTWAKKAQGKITDIEFGE